MCYKREGEKKGWLGLAAPAKQQTWAGNQLSVAQTCAAAAGRATPGLNSRLLGTVAGSVTIVNGLVRLVSLSNIHGAMPREFPRPPVMN